MALSGEQTEELYRTSLKNRTDITWIRECLEKNNSAMIGLSKQQNALEGEQALLKGRLGGFILVLTFAATLLFNGSLFLLSHF